MNCPDPGCTGILRKIKMVEFSDESGLNIEAVCTSCPRDYIVEVREEDFRDIAEM
jgi:hypothetical protein